MKNTNTFREHPEDPLLTFQTVETQKLELMTFIVTGFQLRVTLENILAMFFWQALGHNPDISTNQNI